MVKGLEFSPNKKGLSILYLIIYIIILVIVVVVVVKVYKALKGGANDIGNLASDTVKSAQSGISLARIQQIRNTAETLYKNRFQYSYTPWDDWDEAAFVTAINQMADLKELQLLCQFYQELGDKSIAFVIKDSFSSAQIAQLKTGYYAAALSY